MNAVRARARSALSGGEAARMRLLLAKPLKPWNLKFDDLTRAYHHMLYLVAVMDTALSVNEIRYLLVAKWQSNTDEASLRQRVALAVEQGELRWRRGDRYSLTPEGVEHLRRIEERVAARREGRPWVRPGRRERGGRRGVDGGGRGSGESRRGRRGS